MLSMTRKLAITVPVFLLCISGFLMYKPVFQYLSGPEEAKHYLVPILCFHDVDGKGPYSVTRKELRYYLQTLKEENIRIVPLKEVVRRAKQKQLFKEPTMAITIDDNFENIARVAAPMLREFGYPATFFVYTQNINSHPRGGMAWEDLKRLLNEGFDIQNHSHTHTAFHKPRPGEPEEFFKRRVDMEISGSKKILEKNLPGHEIWAFAYPMGYYSDYLVSQIEKEGYELALTVDANPVDLTKGFHGSFDRYTIQKYLVDDPEAMFRLQISHARQEYDGPPIPEIANKQSIR